MKHFDNIERVTIINTGNCTMKPEMFERVTIINTGNCTMKPEMFERVTIKVHS